jgi:hypothetical protein
VLEAVFVLLEFSSPSRRIFIGSHSLPPSLVRRIGPSNSKMFGMLLPIFRMDKDTIDKDHYEFVELRHKHGVLEVHEIGWSIFETKGHH